MSIPWMLETFRGIELRELQAEERQIFAAGRGAQSAQCKGGGKLWEEALRVVKNGIQKLRKS